MKASPKISFVIPVRNRANMVLDALQSLKGQTVSEWEAIIVDDNSSDNLEEVINGYDPRVRYARLPQNRGSGSACARNYGNYLAKTELIAVLDSDDLAKPNRVERALKSYEEHKWDFYCAGRELVGEMKGALTIQKTIPEVWDSELFKTQSYVTHSSVVYTKKAALEIPYNCALPALSDYDLISRFITLGKKMYLDPVITAVYRRHENETITTHIPQELRVKLLHTIRNWRGWEQEDSDPEY